MYQYKTEYGTNDNRIHLLAEEIQWQETSVDHVSPQVIWEFCREALRLDRQTEEYVCCLCYDAAQHLLGLFEVGHGTVNASLVSPREVFQKALLVGAVSIVLVHNHPSQDLTPSQPDKELTTRIARAGELMGVRLLDHIVVGKERYYSFRECARESLEVAP